MKAADDPRTTPSGRRPGPSDTREAILAAARHAFGTHGRDRATVRAIAAEAGVDPALLLHYFGSKDGLFAAATELPIDTGALLEHVVPGDPDGLADRMLGLALAAWADERTRDVASALVRTGARRAEPAPAPVGRAWRGTTMTASAEPAIAVERLRIARGGRLVIPGLDAEVPAGRITGLLGPSGSGKSTLLRAIVRVQRTLGGRVTVLGRPAGSASLRSEIGYMTQAPSVYGDLSAAENLAFFARVLGVGEPAIDPALATVGLEAERGQLVGSMSGGQRTRVSLATALLGRPRLLVLDEPTVGLDPVLRDDLWDTFAGLARAGTTLVVSSHVMDDSATIRGRSRS